MLRLTYDDLGVKLAVTLDVCDCCARSKAKARALIKKTYAQAIPLVEGISVGTNGAFPKSLTGICYYICVVDDYRNYSWSFFIKKKSQIPKKMEEFL